MPDDPAAFVAAERLRDRLDRGVNGIDLVVFREDLPRRSANPPTSNPALTSTPALAMMWRLERLFHIARSADWEQARRDGAYRVSTLGKRLDTEGFIHLSFAHQVKAVADRFYRGMPDLVLIELDPGRLDAPVRLEQVPGAEEKFPHLYGEIAPGAVLAVRPYRPRADGSFDPAG